MTNLVTFPGLGLSFEINRVAFSIGGIAIYWYGIMIAVGIMLAMVFAFRHCAEFGIDGDTMVDVIVVGVVLPIGGLKEKSIAAYRAGVKTVLIPAENLPDLEEIDPSVRKGMEFLPMETIDQVLEQALVLPEKPETHRSMDPSVVLVKNPVPAENATMQQ